MQGGPIAGEPPFRSRQRALDNGLFRIERADFARVRRIGEAYFFGALAGGDVDDRGEHVLTARRLQGAEADLNRYFAAVFVQAPEFAAGGAGLPELVAVFCAVGFAETLGNQHFDRVLQKLRAQVAEHHLEAIVHERDAPAGVGYEHRVSRTVEDQTHLLFAVRALFGEQAFRDVDDRRQNVGSAARLHGVQADLNRHFAAVFAQAEELVKGIHRPAGRGREILRAQARGYDGMEAFRYEHLRIAADHFIGVITEDGFRMRVREHDRAAAVPDHDGDRRRLEHNPELFLFVVHCG